MRHVEEYRDPQSVAALRARIERVVRHPWRIMEVCGGQTHSILRFGLDQLLPPALELLHGPGCPVCVTPIDKIDRALAIAARPEVILCSFGDMLRVPGTTEDLLTARARGADVRVVWSPLDALELARREPQRQVVFLAVGFETTAPTTALAAWQAHQAGQRNFSLLAAHVLVPPALEALLSDPEHGIDALLAPGHVCVITGTREYEPVSERFRLPIVVTGFEPVDLLRGLLAAIEQLERGEARVENRYERVSQREGNRAARDLVDRVFRPCDLSWRGLGCIPRSGLELQPAFADFDAEARFLTDPPRTQAVQAPEEECPAGLVLRGRLRPPDCRHFGIRCTPEHPLGATMVSSEGACAAYFEHRGNAGAAPIGGQA